MKKFTPWLLGLALLLPVGWAKDVSGKVVAVFHEPVAVNNKTLDQVSVTVNLCGSGQFETVHYAPGLVSDDNSLGYLFNHLATAARSTSTRNQYMNAINGYATFVTNDQNAVQKTTFWGYNWECGKNVDGAGAPTAPAAAPASTPGAGQPAKPGAPFGKFPRLGR